MKLKKRIFTVETLPRTVTTSTSITTVIDASLAPPTSVFSTSPSFYFVSYKFDDIVFVIFFPVTKKVIKMIVFCWIWIPYKITIFLDVVHP